MVMQYSPEPQRGNDEGLNIEGAGAIVIDSSEDEDFFDGNSSMGGNFDYELLPQEVPHNANGFNADSDSGNSSEDSLNDVIPRMGILNNVQASVEHNPPAPNIECTSRARSDIEINVDEVRAAMRNITLPPSSFPPWAASVSESQLTEYVLTRVAGRPTNLQTNGAQPQPQ